MIAGPSGVERSGVRMALEPAGMEIVGEAATLDEALELVRTLEPDLCLVDIDLAGGGVDAVERLTRAVPATAVVVIASSDDLVFDALAAGAAGYLPKGMQGERLGHALEGVLRGEAALPRTLVARLIDEFRMRERRRRLPVVQGRRVAFTPREWEILELLRSGQSTKEIAAELFVGEVTVRSHIAAVLRKLGVDSREAAVEAAFPTRPHPLPEP